MKKITFFLMAFLSCLSLSEAQVKLSLVPRVGATWGNMLFTNALTSNVTRVSTPNTTPPVSVNPAPLPGTFKHGFRSRMENQVTRIGFTAGLGLNIAITDKFSVQPELFFTQKGARYIDNLYNATVDSANNMNKDAHILMNFLEMPVIARYDISFGEKFPLKAYLAGGLSFGMGMGGSYRATRVYARDGKTYETTEEGKITFGSLNTEVANQDRAFDNRYEFGVIGAIGLQYPIGSGAIVADIRYNVTVNNLYTKGSNNIPLGFDNVSKNRAASVTLGYMLPIGKGATATSTGSKKRK